MRRELRTGWRRWTYRPEHSRSARRRAHLATGAALWMSVKFRR